MVLYILACLILIMFVLLQPSKSDASGVFGGGLNSAAFGPRGTQTVLAKVTITAAIAFFLIAFLFSIPGLFDKKSLGEKSGPAEPGSGFPAQQSGIPPNSGAAPITTEQAPPQGAATTQPANSGAATGSAAQQKQATPAQPKPAGAKGAKNQ